MKSALEEMSPEEFERQKAVTTLDFVPLARIERVINRRNSYCLHGKDAVLIQEFVLGGKLVYPEYVASGIVVGNKSHERILEKIESLRIYDISDMD